MSSSGIQQGDPLGPALFCLAVQPIAQSLTTEINLWYLDDSSLGGSADTVLCNLNRVITKSKEIGLTLNLSKCELFFVNVPDALRSRLQASFTVEAPGIRFPEDEDFTLLGAPLKKPALTKAILSKSADLKRLADRLEGISSHYAFYILKNCLSIPKLLYILRCAPSWRDSAALDLFDSSLLITMEKVTNINFSCQARTQAALPVSEGGLGLKQASSLSLPAFLASSYSVSGLVTAMVPPEVNNSVDIEQLEARDRWVILTGQQPPSPDSRDKQQSWERGIIEHVKKDLHQRATTLLDKARLVGVASKASGAFLNAVPSPSLGTFLPDPVFRIAVCLRIGAPICQPHRCHCGHEVDHTGLHGLDCKKNAGRASRHAMANDVIRRGLVSAGFPVALEPSFLSSENNKRPDGITLSPWERGKSLAWDFTCVNSQATSYIASSAGIPLHAARTAELKKIEKYSSLGQNFHFVPIAAECLGSFGKESLKVLSKIGSKITELSQEKRAHEYFLQRLSVAIQKGNAAAILGSIPRNVSLEEEVCLL